MPVTGACGHYSGARARVAAAGLHLLLSALAAVAVLATVFLGWYPSPLHDLVGVGTILLLMLGVDVVLGPLCTAIVYDRSKKSLRTDLAVIVAIQVVALIYGIWTVHQGRPAWLVFVKDRFEVVSPAELARSDQQALAANPAARPDPFGPIWVAARMPDSPQEASRILTDSLAGGRDLQHYPALYEPYPLQAKAAAARGLPIQRLRGFNPGRDAELATLLARVGVPEDRLRYLPVRGPAGDGAAILDAASGEVLAVAALVPW